MSARIIAIAVLLATLATPCAWAVEINPVLGKAGEFSISEVDLERFINNQSPETQQQLAAKPELKAGLVEELLLIKAIARQAKKEGYDRKPEFREQLGYLIDDFLARDYLAKVVVAGVTVSEEALQKYYQEHEKNFLLPESARVRHIFVKAAAALPEEEKKKAFAKAEGLLQRLQKGEDFAKVVAEASEDSDTAGKGGDLGVISPGKTNSTEFEKAVFSLKVGETSAVITSSYGYHIVRVEEKSPGRVAPFAEAKVYISGILKKEYEQKKAQEFMAKTAKESGLEVFRERIVVPEKEETVKMPGK